MSAFNLRSVRRLLQAALFAAAVAIALSLATGRSEAVGEMGASDKHEKSAALAVARDIDRGDAAAPRYTPEQARAAVARIGENVPVPDGGNFNGIRFEDIGPMSVPNVQALMEYNAACKWWRAMADGRELADAQLIVREIPRWPSFRGGDREQVASLVAAELAAGSGPVREGVLRDCRATRDREVAYARARGLTPTT